VKPVKKKTKKPRQKVTKPKPTRRRGVSLRAAKVEVLKGEIARASSKRLPRWNPDPEDVQRSVAQLVLALVEFLRKLLERQAVRRMEGETLSPTEIERIGLALMQLEQTVIEMADRFGLAPEDLNLDLGPLGRLNS
jgi:hypothetical protein